MLKGVVALRDELLHHAGEKEIDLQLIDQIVKERTVIDIITYVQFDAGPNNPIWGEFQRWSRAPTVYAPAETVVEIRYAAHLTTAWRKFVVTKELCHALSASTGSHDVTSVAIDSVVNSFSLLSNAEALKELALPFVTELMAEVGAVEVICPLQRRKAILAENKTPDVMKMAELFNLPVQYTNRAFNPGYMAAIEHLINNS